MWSVRGKVAVVIGASGALGKAVAQRLADEHGAIVGLVSYSRPASLLPSSGTSTASAKRNAASFQCDITKREACDALFRDISTSLGPVAMVVNCAGTTLSKVFLRNSDDDYDRVMALNLRGALQVTQAALRYGGMRSPDVVLSGGGSVVLLGSVAGVRGNEGQVLYSASKAALSGAVQSLAKEYGSKQLRFNVVAPGLVADTDMFKALNEEQRKGWEGQSTLGRCATIEEVSEAIVAVGLSSFMSGQTVELSGGWK